MASDPLSRPAALLRGYGRLVRGAVDPGLKPLGHSSPCREGRLGLDCRGCHVGATTADRAGFSDTETCMSCHATISRTSPHLRALAPAHRAEKKIAWVRVHKVPDSVFFSHASHVMGGVTCADCHGPVEKRDVLAQEDSKDMAACMKCHAERAVSNECTLCHQRSH